MDTMISISLEDYVNLLEDQRWLSCLEAAGVDNWEGISYAQDLFDKDEEHWRGTD